MSHAIALDGDRTQDATADELIAAFRTWGLAGSIDRLTVPLRRQGVCVRMETPHHGLEIPAACAILLYRAGQEILTNAFRHSNATEMAVRLEAVYHGIRLTITDNGIGFSPESQAEASRNHRYGVCLMTMAVNEAHGFVSVDSAPGRGTKVAVTIPLD